VGADSFVWAPEEEWEGAFAPEPRGGIGLAGATVDGAIGGRRGEEMGMEMMARRAGLEAGDRLEAGGDGGEGGEEDGQDEEEEGGLLVLAVGVGWGWGWWRSREE